MSQNTILDICGFGLPSSKKAVTQDLDTILETFLFQFIWLYNDASYKILGTYYMLQCLQHMQKT